MPRSNSPWQQPLYVISSGWTRLVFSLSRSLEGGAPATDLCVCSNTDCTIVRRRAPRLLYLSCAFETEEASGVSSRRRSSQQRRLREHDSLPSSDARQRQLPSRRRRRGNVTPRAKAEGGEGVRRSRREGAQHDEGGRWAPPRTRENRIAAMDGVVADGGAEMAAEVSDRDGATGPPPLSCEDKVPLPRSTRLDEDEAPLPCLSRQQ